jgi:hypothetical protein
MNEEWEKNFEQKKVTKKSTQRKKS